MYDASSDKLVKAYNPQLCYYVIIYNACKLSLDEITSKVETLFCFLCDHNVNEPPLYVVAQSKLQILFMGSVTSKMVVQATYLSVLGFIGHQILFIWRHQKFFAGHCIMFILRQAWFGRKIYLNM